MGGKDGRLQNVTRAKRRLEELSFSAVNRLQASVTGFNGIGQQEIVTMVVAYAPNKDAAEGEMINYMSALVPARELVYVLTGANARAAKRGEVGWETHNKVLDPYSRDTSCFTLQKRINTIF